MTTTTENKRVGKHQFNCLYCGKEFTAIRSDKKFCTGTCKAKNHVQKKSEAKNEAGKKSFLKRIINWISQN